MAGELTYTGSGNLFIAALLNATIAELDVDRSDLSVTCQDYGGDLNGSTASKVPTITYNDAMAAANADEITPVANTGLTTGAATITVARQALVRQVSHLYQLVTGPRPGLERLASDMLDSASLRKTDMIAALYSSFTPHVNETGQPMTVDAAMDALYLLIRGSKGGSLNLVLAPIAFTQFLDDLRSTGQQLTPLDAGSSLNNAGNRENGWGVYGTFAGMTVWSCNSVPTSGGDRISALYAPKAIGRKHGIPSELMRGAAPGSMISMAADGIPIYIGIDRDEAAGLTSIVGNLFFGCSIIDANHGVKITTSAT